MNVDPDPPPAAAQSVQTQAKAPTCYNCGDSGHYFDACPEPARKIPVGLAAAQAAKAKAGLQSQNRSYNAHYNGAKRQKTGCGPVVTRYPVPGPVVTKYGPPPGQHLPYGGAQGFNNNIPSQQFSQPTQYYPQPQQSFTHHIPQAQNSGYPSYGYQQPPVQQPSQYQYSQYPPAAQGQAYGAVAPQIQGYGYTQPAAAPYYDQSYGQNMSYGQPDPAQYAQQQYPMQYPSQQQQPPMPYQQQPMQYGPLAQQQAGPPHAGPYGQAAPPTQPYGYGAPPQYTPQVGGQHLSSFQDPGQRQNGSTGSYSNQQNQQWSQSQGPTHRPPAAYGSSNYVDPNNSNARQDSFRQQSSNGPPNIDQFPAVSTSQDQSTHDQQIKQENDGNQSAAPEEDDQFDIEWQEMVFKELQHPAAIPILTPLTTKYDELPTISTLGPTPIKSKYARPTNLEVFTLPIQKSLHWGMLKKDPALAPIDEAYPVVPLESWAEYRDERYKRKLMEDGIDDAPLQETQWYDTVQDEVDDQAMRENTNYQVRDEAEEYQGYAVATAVLHSVPPPSRSRSHTPNIDRKGTPVLDADDDVWAPQPGEGGISRPSSADPTEALLASLGVTGAPKPVTSDTPVPTLPLPAAGHIDTKREPVHKFDAPPRPTRQDSGYASARPSFSNSHPPDLHKISNGRQNSWGSRFPPPPPPPQPRMRSFDARNKSPASEGSIPSHHYARHNSKPNSKTTSPEESPLSPTSAMLLGELSATAEDRYGKRKEPLRQDDDYFVKKRPQPKIADAYSRRW